jgi:hypothetical protein
MSPGWQKIATPQLRGWDIAELPDLLRDQHSRGQRLPSRSRACFACRVLFATTVEAARPVSGSRSSDLTFGSF